MFSEKFIIATAKDGVGEKGWGHIIPASMFHREFVCGDIKQ